MIKQLNGDINSNG